MTRDLLPIASARETFRLTWRLLRARRLLLGLSALSFAGAGVFGLVAPWVLGDMVDTVRSGGTTDEITRSALLIIGAAIGGGVLTSLAVTWLARAGEPALAELREQVLDEVLHLDSARVESAGAGDVLSRVGDDVSEVAESLVEIVPLVVISFLTVALTGVGLFALDWRLGLAGLAAVPGYVLSLRWFLPRSAPIYREERIAQGERAEAMVTGLHGAPTLRSFRRERAHLRTVEDASRNAMVLTLDAFALLTRFGQRTNRAELIGMLFVLGSGFFLVREGMTTVGAVTAAALYFHRLFNPIGALLMVFDMLQAAGASLARLAGVAGGVSRVSSLAPSPSRVTSPDLSLVGVSHHYRPDRPVLREVSLSLPPGETVALVGATGAGKTTLAAIAAGMLRPTTGEVRLDGTALGSSPEDWTALRRQVAWVTQEVHVFSGIVRDNLDLGRAGASEEELRAALVRTRAWPWVAALPEGLDTVIGHGGHAITPAQAQQLALARVLLLDPPLVVLDEATAEAGSSGARELDVAARAVTEGRTALVVAHRLTQASAADRVVVLHDGRVVEQGSHTELLASGGRYADLWHSWIGDE
jgi:ABC-type multidrug transport system fused ATPase/permease subunit